MGLSAALYIAHCARCILHYMLDCDSSWAPCPLGTFISCLLLSASTVNCELLLQLNLPACISKVTLQIQPCHNNLEFQNQKQQHAAAKDVSIDDLAEAV